MTAIIRYRPNSQKIKGYFDKVLTRNILRDICFRVTGQRSFIIERETDTYNRGRLIQIYYKDVKNYISLSEVNIEARNQSLQSVPTAINLFFADKTQNKKLYYYFLPHNGNAFTQYHVFIYKLLMTAGVQFLNIQDFTSSTILPYKNIDEIIEDRSRNQGINAANNSSFISKTDKAVQIYAKTYGASKYESTLFGIAISKISDMPIELFNICEKDLKELPHSSQRTLEALGNITMHNTSITLERNEYLSQRDKSILRSPTYVYNLMNRIGNKKCALCGCEIPEIIQGAHIWGVAEISRHNEIDDYKKFEHAICGHNGLWMCQNHHKLFDTDILSISTKGQVYFNNNIDNKAFEFIKETTKTTVLPTQIMSDQFCFYLNQRNKTKDLSNMKAL